MVFVLLLISRWTCSSSQADPAGANRLKLEFIRRNAHETLLVSVCTGSMILAASGLMDGKSATTKHEITPPEISPAQIMLETYPQVDVRHSSLVAYDKIITGGGVTLCIDTMLYVLEKLFGHSVAAETARILEYKRAWVANSQQLPPITIDTRSSSFHSILDD